MAAKVAADEQGTARGREVAHSDAPPIDTADTVLHGPTGETWIVAYVDGDQLAWCGWPDGTARLANCTLTEKASPAERLALLKHMVSSGSRFARYARGVLAREEQAHG